MTKNKVKGEKGEKKVEREEVKPEQFSSDEEPSSEDDDGALLTSKVQKKLLLTLADIKMKNPSIYKTKQPLYQQDDFEEEDKVKKVNGKSKYTYKDLQNDGDQQDEENLPPVMEQKKAKQRFKNILNKNIQKINEDEEDLFTVKQKLKKEKTLQKKDQQKQKFEDLTKTYDKESKKKIKKFWNSNELDETDLFMKQYILNRKWLSSKMNKKQDPIEQEIDDEDEERSLQMDKFEAEYNFRFEEPGGTTITQYPRNVQNSLRQKTETRREKRKKREQKKKQEELQLRKATDKRRQELRKGILQKMVPQQQQEQQEEHDWFFCDDCCKGLQEGQKMWQCSQCQDFMLCDECNELIIHKHQLIKGTVPRGYGAPPQGQTRVKELEPCTMCRRRVTLNNNRYQYTDRNYIVNALCQTCYDKSGLDIKKKYKLVQSKEVNYQELLDQNPEKIKELTNLKQIQEMVDQYIKNDFEGVLSGGLKAKFKYIQVKPESYGLSDEQILFGQDKELNKYISVKNLAPYREEKMRLRNNIFKKRIKSIKRSVKTNQALLEKTPVRIAKIRYIQKRKNRAESVRKRLQKKIRVINISDKNVERDHFIPKSRLFSYGIATQNQQ